PQRRARPHRRAREPSPPHGPRPRARGRLGRGRAGPEGFDRRDAGGAAVRTLVEILDPNFLLHDALVGSVLVGLVCPLVGVYFVLPRMIFLGVAPPQLSAAGIAFAFLAYRTVVGVHAHEEPSERALAMAGSFAFTVV